MSQDDGGITAEDLYDQAPCGYLSTSSDGTVVRVNRTLLRWIGRTADEVRGHQFADLLTPGALLFYETHYRALLHVQGRVDGISLDLRDSDGRPLPVLVTAEQHPGADGGPGPVHVSLFSTRSRAVYEQDLRRSRQRAEQAAARLRLLHDVREACQSALEPHDVAAAVTRSLTSATRGGSVAVWLADDDEGCLLLETGTASAFAPAVLSVHDPIPAAEAVRRGEPLAALQPDLRRSWPDVAGPMADVGREALLVLPLVAEDSVVGVVQVALRRQREVAPEELETLAELGHTAGQALLRCRLPAHLRGLPLRDAVTGTATPALFGERVGAALARGAEASEPVAVLLADVAVTGGPADRDGAAATVPDDVMAELGRRLRGLEGAASTARVGPHRFAVLHEGCDVQAAGDAADELQRVLEGAEVDGASTVATVGAAVVDPRADGRSVSVSTLLGWASSALHDALGRGAGRRVVHGPSTRQAARALVDAERDLRRALDEDGVVLHYQPIVHLRTGRVVGVETLCRLRRPDGTLQPPSQFIDAAEDSGLVVPLGRQTLRQACAQQRRWTAQGTHLDVAVNVAAAQAADPEFAREVLDVLTETGCPAHRLVLELTESALLAAAPSTLSSFEGLRAAGVRVALDDFGTRYASLDYVRSFPLDELKIDQAFVAGLPLSRVARAIVRMVSQLASELDLACVAEGIETAGQAAFLRDLGVLGQGFALGRPVPADQVATWVTPTSWLAASAEAPWDEQEQPHRA